MTPLEAITAVLTEVHTIGDASTFVMTESVRQRILRKADQAATPLLRAGLVQFFKQLYNFDLEKPMLQGTKKVWSS